MGILCYDAGYSGQLESLGGRKGREGYGSVVNSEQHICTLGYNRDIVPANPNRLWIIIQNIPANTGSVGVTLGTKTPSASDFVLDVGDSLVLDKNLPWTGSIGIYQTNAVTQYVNVIESELVRSE